MIKIACRPSPRIYLMTGYVELYPAGINMFIEGESHVTNRVDIYLLPEDPGTRLNSTSKTATPIQLTTQSL